MSSAMATHDRWPLTPNERTSLRVFMSASYDVVVCHVQPRDKTRQVKYVMTRTRWKVSSVVFMLEEGAW